MESQRSASEKHDESSPAPESTWVATLSLSVLAEPSALAAARGALDGLEPLLAPEVFADLRLVINELVKNGLQHGARGPGAKISFEVSVSSKVRAQVTDFGSSFEQWSMKPTPERESGWGLYIVDRLTDSWGILREQGTHVSLVIDRGRPEDAPGSSANPS